MTNEKVREIIKIFRAMADKHADMTFDKDRLAAVRARGMQLAYDSAADLLEAELGT